MEIFLVFISGEDIRLRLQCMMDAALDVSDKAAMATVVSLLAFTELVYSDILGGIKGMKRTVKSFCL